MQRLLLFLTWAIALGIAIRWESGWVIAGLILAGIAALIQLVLTCRYRRQYHIPRLSRDIPLTLFAMPQLYADGPFLTDPELDEKLRGEEDATRSLHKKTVIGLWLLIFPGLPILLTVIWKCGAIATFIIATLSGLILLTVMTAKVIRKKQLAHWNFVLRQRRDLQLAKHFRPSTEDRIETLCRHYRTSLEAEAACRLAELAGIDFPVYPQDSLRLAAGDQYAKLLKAFVAIDISPLPETFGEAVTTMPHRLHPYFCCIPEELPIPKIPQEPPPLSDKLTQVRDALRKKQWNALDESLFHEEILRRPKMTEQLFCSYWPDAESAWIALQIRKSAILHMYREDTMMCYPNDPMALLLHIADDSMESIEFVMSLETEFGISLSDSETEKLLSLTLAEAVALVRRKPGTAATKGAGEN